MMGPGMMGGGMMGSWGGLGWISGIVLVGLGVLAVVLILRPQKGGAIDRGGGGPAPSPREILETRYARGEITRDQFEQMKADLGL
jgi:putative membrane protein